MIFNRTELLPVLLSQPNILAHVSDSSHRTPLQLSVELNRTDMARLLLQRVTQSGPDLVKIPEMLSVTDDNGRNMLHLAAGHGCAFS